MVHADLILTITSGLFTALILGFAMHRFGLSPVVGYLLAGIAVGPATPGFVADEQAAAQLAEIGVVLLMFGVGLQFHLHELAATRRVVVPGALAGIATATGLGWLAARTWDYEGPASVVFGLAVAVASTVVLVRVLSDQGDLHTPRGRSAVAWLVVEDIFTVLALVALPLWLGKDDGRPLWLSLGLAALGLGGFVVLMLVVGRRVIPRLFEYAARTRSRELFTLTVLVTALGIAVGSARFFGASMALGAFLAGTIVGQSEFSARAAGDALPMRDAFSVLFFVSVGMLFHPTHLMQAPGEVALVLAIVLLGKPLAAFAVMRLLDAPARLALPVAASLTQLGEFSFVLASVGQSLGVLPKTATSTLVAVAILSITLNPLLYKLALRRAASLPDPRAVPSTTIERSTGRDLALVVGHGPTGQIVCDILRDNGVDTVIIDLNLETVRKLTASGAAAVYGDAVSADVLDAAGVRAAKALFLTSSGLEHTVEVIRTARRLNPEVRVYTRTSYLREVDVLRKVGASTVVSAEGEVALTMATALLDDLGASPDQIARERDRMHDTLAKRITPA
jgi:CPA2 family monovalent cation:H+ antiporter-2